MDPLDIELVMNNIHNLKVEGWVGELKEELETIGLI
jgi:hypothetical protein